MVRVNFKEIEILHINICVFVHFPQELQNCLTLKIEFFSPQLDCL